MKFFNGQRKRLFSFVLAFALIISIFSIMPLSASAAIGDVFTVDGFEYTVTNEIYGSYTVCVTGFDNSTNEIIIPEKVTNINTGIEYSVTEIKNTVFQGNTDIVSVNLPGTVKQTSPDCFANCTSLNKITLNEGIEWIVASTFSGTAIEEITFPKSLNKISNYAFEKCLNLKNIYINSDANITATIFRNSTAIENVYCYSQNIQFKKATLNYTNKALIIHGYSGSTAETYANTYGYNFALIEENPSESTEPSTEVTEPSTEVTEPSTDATEPSTDATEPQPTSEPAAIGDTITIDGLTYTVSGNVYGSYTVSVTGFDNSTTNVVIPEKVNIGGTEYSVTEIKNTVFQGNTDIVSVNLPGTMTTIINQCFYNCTSLKNVTLNEGIETIYASAFRNTAIETIEFPKSLTRIANNAFRNCLNLKKVYIYSDADLTATVFMDSTAIEDVYCYSQNILFQKATLDDTNKTLIIHGYSGSTAETYANTYGYNFSLIEEYPSSEPTEPSTGATEPSTEPDTSIFKWKKINNDTAVEITGIKDEYKWQVDIEIPSEINGLPVTVIGVSAFERGQVIYLTIPSSVFIISDKAFKDCSGLTTITFAENSRLQKIGNEAFFRTPGGGDNLNSVDLPESLKLLGYNAFYNRANLLTVRVYSKDVYFGDPAKGKDVFALNTGTSNLKLYGYLDSTTQAYAAENEHPFRDIELDKTPLKELIDTAKAIDPSGYTKESYANLTSELEKANTTYRAASKWEVTHIEVEQAIADLKNAIDNLVVYVEPTTTEPNTTEPGTTEPTTTEPNTTEPGTTEPNTTEPNTTAPVEYIEYVLGDVDGTEGISIDDATAIQLHAAEIAVLKGADLFAADVNADGKINIEDVTLIQKWLAAYEEAMSYKIGEKFVKEVVPTQPTDPQPTDPQPTDPQPTDPQPTDPQPTDPQPTDPDEETFTFYLPNYVSWLTDMGGKMWIYNNETEEFLLLEYDGDEDLFFYDDLPVRWTDMGIYRTPYETTEEEFDIHDDWDEATQTGVILNKWENLGDRGDNNCFKITGDGEGFYTMYDPDENPDDERTIYFDNSKTQWGAVYIYGWSFGIYQEFIPLENEGNDIWSYTFYDELPVDGVKGFLFVNQPSWSGATQTGDLATEKGKNLFTPIPGGQKLNGTWSVYNP